MPLPRVALRKLVSALTTAIVLAGIPTRGDELADVLRPLIEKHRGRAAVACKHLESGESFTHNADVPMPTASLIKLPLMIAAYQAIADGRVRPDQMITLKQDDKVPGSGILTTHFSAGTTISLRDAIRLMIAYSDNTATNLVIEQVGLPATAELMASLGHPETKLHSQVYRRGTSIFPDRSEKFGLGSTTAADMVALLEQLHAKQLVTEQASTDMLAHLAACEDTLKFPRLLPNIKIAHKTGSVNAVRTDAGILTTPSGPIALCVLTAENKDQSWGDENEGDLLCARIAQAVVRYFNPGESGSQLVDSGPLKLGAQGSLVEGLQRTLNARMQPSPGLSVDGDFGPATEAAVLAFQELRSLEATGVVGPETWAALGPLVEASDAGSDEPDPPLVRAPADPLAGQPFVTCKAWAVADAETGEIVGGDHLDERLHFASTTKMMTGWLVARYAQEHPEVLAEQLTFSVAADETNGSTSDIRAGETIAVSDLLFGLLLPSGNDASIALAEHFGARLAGRPEVADPREAVELFVGCMNAAAEELGMSATSFKNPHGLSAAGHLSSARDLLRLARAALKTPLFEQIVNTPRYECVVVGPGGYQRKMVWRNTNHLLGIEGYDGVKTGTTTLAGACLVSRGRRDGRALLMVVLGSASSESRYTDSRNLYRWAWREVGN